MQRMSKETQIYCTFWEPWRNPESLIESRHLFFFFSADVRFRTHWRGQRGKTSCWKQAKFCVSVCFFFFSLRCFSPKSRLTWEVRVETSGEVAFTRKQPAQLMLCRQPLSKAADKRTFPLIIKTNKKNFAKIAEQLSGFQLLLLLFSLKKWSRGSRWFVLRYISLWFAWFTFLQTASLRKWEWTDKRCLAELCANTQRLTHKHTHTCTNARTRRGICPTNEVVLHRCQTHPRCACMR